MSSPSGKRRTVWATRIGKQHFGRPARMLFVLNRGTHVCECCCSTINRGECCIVQRPGRNDDVENYCYYYCLTCVDWED